MFCPAAQALMGAMVVHVEGRKNRAQTVPFSCPFRTCFVPVSCVARPRWCSISLIGHLPS